MRAYAAYKDSRVDWLGAIPETWAPSRMRYLATIETGSRDTVEADSSGEYPFVVRSPQLERIGTFGYDTEAVLTAGDGDVGKIFHHLRAQFDAHQRVYVMHTFRGVTGRWFFYYLSALFRNITLAGTAKSTVDSLRRPMLSNFVMLRPPVGEQIAITDYLDRETARIDELIAEQEALVATLIERRSGVITHLTDGAESEVVSLGRVLAAIRQGWSPNCEAISADGIHEWGVLKTGCVNGGVFRATENKRLPDDEEPRPGLVIRADEVVMSRASTSELVGSAARVSRDFPKLMLSDLTYGLTTAPTLSAAFAAYALSGQRVRGVIASVAKGTSSSMQKLSQRDVKELPLRVPSLDEQSRIVSMLDEQTSRIDDLTRECRKLITLLKERRSALITAAVTGKIDVRDLEAVAEAPQPVD